jgi:archaellum component FlaG (FlaF/FlaG flagellin family)
MDIRKLLIKIIGEPFGEDVIHIIRNNGNHILSSGKVAPVLTDERLKNGDRVITVKDDQGKIFILSGKK